MDGAPVVLLRALFLSEPRIARIMGIARIGVLGSTTVFFELGFEGWVRMVRMGCCVQLPSFPRTRESMGGVAGIIPIFFHHGHHSSISSIPCVLRTRPLRGAKGRCLPPLRFAKGVRASVAMRAGDARGGVGSRLGHTSFPTSLTSFPRTRESRDIKTTVFYWRALLYSGFPRARE